MAKKEYDSTDVQPVVLYGTVAGKPVQVTINADGSLNTQLVDAAGNPIASHVSADGDYHLGVQMEQAVLADANNSSTDNLVVGDAYTFTGVGTSTLGVVGLQWSLKTDKNCTVYIEQSDEQAANWDLCATYDYYYSKGGAGGTVQALKSYWRIRVVATETTGYFRLTGVLCPIAEPLPKQLSNSGNLQCVTSLRGNENYGRHVWVNPTNELNSSPVYRLIGTAFDDDGDGGDVDSNFWTAAITNAGSVVQDGGIVTLNTNTTAGGTAKLTSAREARFVAGSAQLFVGAFASSAPAAGNTRRIGPYSTTDGAFAQLAGSIFSLGTRKDSSDTLINSGSFNGNLGADFTPAADTYYKLTIELTPLSVDWYTNGKLLHHKAGANWSDTLTLPVTMENNNVAVDTENTFKSVGCYIARQGELVTNPTSYYHALGTEAGATLKYGAGTLRGIIVSNCVKLAVITLSDSTTAITPTIWTFTSGKLFELPTMIDFFGLPFSNGLRLYVTAENACVTVVYE